MSHTKGPWTVESGDRVVPEPSKHILILGPEKENGSSSVIAEINKHNKDVCYEDATLIAAAPEILEALKQCICALHDYNKLSWPFSANLANDMVDKLPPHIKERLK